MRDPVDGEDAEGCNRHQPVLNIALGEVAQSGVIGCKGANLFVFNALWLKNKSLRFVNGEGCNGPQEVAQCVVGYRHD